MPKLSVIIITKNEAINIVDCIKSASFADEVLVLDSSSSDSTVQLAIEQGARVITTDWPGFGQQKNRAIEASTGEWIFSLDADERISPALADEIKVVITQEKFDVFDVPRKSLFVSKFMAHSGWWPDRTKRLFKRNHAAFSDHQVHEHLQTNAIVGRLKHHLIHYSYRELDSVLDKINRYSSAGARDMHLRGKQGSLTKAISHGLWAFIRTYLIRAGFLDGREGLMLAIANAEVTYYRYIKLAYLSKDQKR